MIVTGKTMLFRNDYEGRSFYKRGVSWKEYKDGKETGKWLAVYEPVKMPKGTDLPDRTIIDIKNAFESGYVKNDGTRVRQLVVLEYDLVDEGSDSFEAIEEKLPF